MAKPPKKTSNIPPSDTSSTPHRTSSGEDLVRGDHSLHPGVRLPEGEASFDAPPSTPRPNTMSQQQPVVVTDMPARKPDTFHSDLVSWPRNQVDQLFRISDTGLYMSKEQKLYADVENAGLGRVELNANGDYQVHFPFAPDNPGPILKKIRGKAQWQFKEPWPASQAEGSNTNAPVTFINQAAVKKIPAADEGLGIRWYNRKSYVDLIDEGTVLVVKNVDGDYQATTPQELAPSGPVVERIGVTQLWKRKSEGSRPQQSRETSEHASASEDFGPDPAKRPRTEENRDAPASAITSGFNPYLWASWGKIMKPEAGDSVQIDQLHYQIVPQGEFPYPLLTYLQHPEFVPSRFEAFEKMLRESPWLQPVAAMRENTNSPWKVQGISRQFDRPITQTVMDSFKDFTVHTSRAVAKQLLERSGHSEIITQERLSATSVTLRHWKKESTLSVPELENPVDLLPVAPRTGPSGEFISTRPAVASDPLYRLDFNIQRYRVEWNRYLADKSDSHLKSLVTTVLINNGYDVFPFKNVPWSSVLIFKRANHDKIYFLKLGFAEGDFIDLKKTPPELADPGLLDKVGYDAYLALMTADAQNNVVWLIGGVQSTASGWHSVFIIRER